jgi:polyisoprenyl-phosphate glycosyltransferase
MDGCQISVVTNCFNEASNVEEVYQRVRDAIQSVSWVSSYEHIFIDNASTDQTVPILRKIAESDFNLKIIVNNRNFGQVRSANHGLFQASGHAVIHIVADLQDPPELIPEFLEKWRQGYAVVIGQKRLVDDGFFLKIARGSFYKIMERLSETPQIKNFTGFGLYDHSVVKKIEALGDPYPYFRGLIMDLGFKIIAVPYDQPGRVRGVTSHNFYSLYDLAMLGITNHSKVPLRLATFFGFVLALVSGFVGLFYLFYKVLAWDHFDLGVAPLVIGVFFFSSVQLFFIGIMGEYIGSIHTQVLKRPMVVEKERINFNSMN